MVMETELWERIPWTCGLCSCMQVWLATTLSFAAGISPFSSLVYVCVGGAHYKMCMASKDDFWELALSFHHMGPGIELR